MQVTYPIIPEKTAMIVVDMQNDFVAAGAAMETPAARDAMFRNYWVVFLSDATATYDYPDRGFGAMPAAQVHHTTLVILAASTAHVMSVKDMRGRLSRRA